MRVDDQEREWMDRKENPDLYDDATNNYSLSHGFCPDCYSEQLDQLPISENRKEKLMEEYRTE